MSTRVLTFAKRLLSTVLFGTLFVTLVVSAFDSIAQNISPQNATQTGSNNTVWFSTGTISASQYFTQYVNLNDDSATIGNYFHGYYYDTQFGFFKLDWDSDVNKNVRVISSTDRCATGYGYKLGGFAQGVDAGLINFNYSSDAFVYYCESDSKLHGYAYNEDYGFQSFEWISFTIAAVSTQVPLVQGSSDPFFVNNQSMILSSPVGFSSIQWDEQSSEWGKSALFFIVK